MLRIELAGAWRLRKSDEEETIRATVPGCVHTELLAAKKIPEPFYRDNEHDIQWVGESEWVYSRTFSVSKAALTRDRVLLRCEGLDTLATISINGKRVAKTDNMFRTYEFDVKSRLVAGKNEISIHFANAVAYARKRDKANELFEWGKQHKLGGVGHIRKEQCSFGWDWGPHFAAVGIWRAIGIVAFDTARVANVQVLQDHAKAPKQVTATVITEVEATGKSALSARVTLSRNGRKVATAAAKVKKGVATSALSIDKPKLWWPNGMGDQPLYDVLVKLLDADGAVIDTRSTRVGLRTLRIEQEDDKWGRSFRFAVNGVAFFAKGANWIPADAFVTRVTRGDYERLLGDAAAVNMNMLRVWGGGIYEDDVFYDLCDEMGLCVWQDFMFACTSYPFNDDAFMVNCKAEFEDNIRRLRNHPSIALWCGNNELESGIIGNKWEGSATWEDYGKLFDVMLPEVTGRLDPTRDYWPCSPHTPVADRTDSGDNESGDIHFWAVWHGRKPFEHYRTSNPRFCSEFGFQSFPELKTVEGYTEPKDRNVTSYVMEHHQRSPIGNTVIMTYLLDWFRLPTEFGATLALTQILQGMGMKYAVEHWRRQMPRTMGALYWQINDCWPVASWASIDSIGRWKALHYMARHFFAPAMISGVENMDKHTVAVHLTSDLLKTTKGRVEWKLTTVDGAIVAKGRKNVSIAARKNRVVETLRLADEVEQHGERDLMLWLDLVIGGKRVSRNFVTFSRPKHFDLQNPGITASVKKAKSGEGFVVTLKSRKPALWTWIEVDGADAVFSDNYVHLLPSEATEIAVTVEDNLSAAELKKALRVRSLIDTYAC